MRRSLLPAMAVAAVCLAFGLSAPRAQKPGRIAASSRPPAAPQSGGGAGRPPWIGPGFGGLGPAPARFLGITARRFPTGIGALALSHACDEELPYSRLCEWGDIFRSLPPVALDTEVLAAASYDSRPAPMCLSPEGRTRCDPAILMRPAACCGIPKPPPPLGSLTLTPADPQIVTDCADVFDFVVTAEDPNGQPMEGVRVFIQPVWIGNADSVQVTLSPANGVTDANGQLALSLSLNISSCQDNCTAPGKDCSTQIQARDQDMLIFSNIVVILDGIP